MVHISTLDHQTYDQYNLDFASLPISYDIERLFAHQNTYNGSSLLQCIDSYKYFLQNGQWQSSDKYDRFVNTFPTISSYKDFSFSPEKDIPFPYALNLTQTLSVPTKIFYQESRKKNVTQLEHKLYPIAVRYVSSNGFFFVERPPFQVEIDLNITHRSSTGKPHFTKIWIPWTLTVFNPKNPTNINIYFSHSSLSSNDTQYAPCFLPNTHNSGTICFGPTLADSNFQFDESSKSDIKYIYSLLFNEYINGGWNLDLHPNIYSYLPSIEWAVSTDPTAYPMLAAYSNPSIDKIKEKCPTFSRKSISNIISKSMYGYSVKDIFKYMFLVMSTFSLQETLDFYQELFNAKSEYSKKSKNNSYKLYTFSDILENSKVYVSNTFYETYHNSSSYIHSHFLRYDSQNSTNYYSYNPLLTSNIIILGAKDRLANFAINTSHSYMHVPVRDQLFELIFTAENYHHLISYLKNFKTHSANSVIIYSLINNSIETLETTQSFQDFYFSYLYNNYSNQGVFIS